MSYKAKAAKSRAAAKARYADGGAVTDYEGMAQDAAEDVTGAMRHESRQKGWAQGDYKSNGIGPTPQNLSNKKYEDKLSGKDRAQSDRMKRGAY